MNIIIKSVSNNRISLKVGLLIGISTTIIPYAAWAQQAQPATLTDAHSEDQASTIVVTGTRIPRAGFDTLEPAITVDSSYVQNRGFTNVADALSATPSFATGQSSSGLQGTFNAGQSFVDRFGLGSPRTLTLVNGRRFVSTNAPSIQGNVVGTPAPAGLQVDLNAIPAILIERVENLSIGGAPVYGSDAIAGVVNIILKTKFEGVKLTAQSGITERGDNFRANFAGLAGFNFGGGRGNIMAAFTYDRTDGLVGAERERFASGYSFRPNPLATSALARIPGRTTANDGRVNPNVPFNTGNSDGIPNQVLIRDRRIGTLTEGGLLLPTTGLLAADGRPVGFGPGGQTRLQFDPSGNLVPYNTGVPFSATAYSGGDGLDFARLTPLLAYNERYMANINASYEITPGSSIFLESSFYKGTGREAADQPSYNSPLFGGFTNVQGGLQFSATDPRLSAASQATLAGLGVTRFVLSRAFADLGNGSGRSDNQVYRVVGGYRSNFDLLGRGMTLEATANYGRTTGKYYQTEIVQQNFVNALNARRDASGNIVCDSNPAFNVAPGTLSPIADANCTVLDPFGAGRRSQAAFDYVTEVTRARSTIEQRIFSISLSTPSLIDLWAGPVGFSVGAEARREFGSFNPDPLQLAGAVRNGAIVATRGSFNTKEVFGELAIPLVSEDNNVPLVHSLEVEGRARYVDNSVNGGFLTYTAGARYEPVRGVTFRGNFTRSLRSPSITELFMPNAVGVADTFTDPCGAASVVNGSNPTIRQRNCGAFYRSYGIDGATFSPVILGVPTLNGGNRNLDNEVAKAYTFGAVFSPRFFPKLSLAIDWNRIKVTGNISQLTSADIAEGCYDNPDFDLNNPDQGNAFCTLLRRDRSSTRNGQISNDASNPGIRLTFVNGAYISFQGLTATMSVRDIELDAVGLKGTTLNLLGDFYYVDRLCTSNNAVTETCVQGTTENPRYTLRLSGILTHGPFSLFGEVNHRPSTKFNLNFTPESQDILKVSGLTTFNTAIALQKEDWSMRLSVTNLFDKAPPFPLTTGDQLGRRFTFQVSKSF